MGLPSIEAQAAVEKLRAWSESDAGRAARFALKDLDSWLREIARANMEGRRYFQDSDWVWYVHRYRSNQGYVQALSALLGEGFTVELGVGSGSDTIDEYTYDCVRVSW